MLCREWLLLKDIEATPGNDAVLQRISQVIQASGFAAPHVDEIRRALHSAEPLRVPHALGFWRMRGGDNHKIGAWQQGIEVGDRMDLHPSDRIFLARIDPEDRHP